MPANYMGLVTMSTLDLLSMNKKQLLGTLPVQTYTKRDRSEMTQEKPQWQIFTDEELHTNIRNAMKSEANIEEDLDILKP